MSILAEHKLPELGSPSRVQSFHDQNLYFEKKKTQAISIHLASVLKKHSFGILFDQQLAKNFHRETQYVFLSGFYNFMIKTFEKKEMNT